MTKLDYRQFEDYVFSLVHAIPYSIYEGIASISCLGLVVFIAWKGFKTGLWYSAALLLIEYIFLLFCSTVIFRTTGEVRQYDFHPFWSYARPELFVENIMNVIVFIPVGMILGSLLRVKVSWSKYGSWFKVKGSWLMVKGSWLMVTVIGCSISISIEAMQFFFHRGFAETDDVMHNTLGCIFGYSLWLMVHGSWCMVKDSR